MQQHAKNSKDKVKLSGFSNINTGDINDCYVNEKVKGLKKYGGFCNNNKGDIKNCYVNLCSHNNKNPEFFLKNTGGISSSFILAENSDEEIDNVPNNEMVPVLSKINEEKLNELGWDIENVWDCKDTDVEFQDDKFCYKIEDKSDFKIIHSKEELIELAENVNEQKEEYVHGKFQLANDIDLEGIKWIPIGATEEEAFEGTFDGNGHKIYNFKIKDKNSEYVGFFGYVKNATIVNLDVDGIVSESRRAGLLAGVSIGGLISCCSASGKVEGKIGAAGFVYKNAGTIDRCYCVGYVKKLPLIPWWLWLLISGFLLALLFLLLMLLTKPQEKLYPAVKVSPYAEQVEESTADSGKNSFTFKIEEKDKIIFKSGEALTPWKYQNPGTSNHGSLLELRVADDSGAEHTIAKSDGIVPAGAQLNYLLYEGNLSPGKYKGVLYMLLYNESTQEKAVTDVKFPIDFEVR